MNKSFHSSTKSLLQINKLLNFEKPEPFAKFKNFMKEQKTEEWPVDIALEIAALEIVSWRLFEINK